MYDFDAILKHAVAFHIIQYLCMQIEGFGLHKFFSLPAPARSFFLLQTLICPARYIVTMPISVMTKGYDLILPSQIHTGSLISK